MDPSLILGLSVGGSLLAYTIGYALGRYSAPEHPVVTRLRQIEADKDKPFDGSEYWAKHKANLAADQRKREREQIQPLNVNWASLNPAPQPIYPLSTGGYLMN